MKKRELLREIEELKKYREGCETIALLTSDIRRYMEEISQSVDKQFSWEYTCAYGVIPHIVGQVRQVTHMLKEFKDWAKELKLKETCLNQLTCKCKKTKKK